MYLWKNIFLKIFSLYSLLFLNCSHFSTSRLLQRNLLAVRPKHKQASFPKSLPWSLYFLYCVASPCDITVMVMTITALLQTDRLDLRKAVLHVIHFLFIRFVLRTGEASQWSACLSIVILFISLELDVSGIARTIWSVEITTFRQIHSVRWQYNSDCGTMCCQSAAVASCSSRIECPGLSEMIHNSIGYDALTENKILCYQYHNITA